MIVLRKIVVVLALFGISSIYAGFQSRVLTLNSRTMVADDEMVGSESLTLTCKEWLQGTGYIKSPRISITVKKFEFTGTIHCDGTCHITAQEPFDETMFKREGTGSFIVTINPNLNFEELKDPAMPVPSITIPSPIIPRIPSINFPSPVVPHIPKYSFTPAPGASRKIDIKGNIFTVEGEWHIAMAEAIQKGNEAEVTTLLGKNSSIKNNTQLLALFMMMAGLSGHISLVEKFIQLGADVNSKDRDGFGQEHLITAAGVQQPDFVAALLKAGANPNVRNENWITPLMIAVIQEDLNTVKTLIQSPTINLNNSDKDNHTALMHAAIRGNTAIVTALLEAGANLDEKDWNRNTALDLAIANNKKETIELLSKKSKSLHPEEPFYKDGRFILAAAVVGIVLANPCIEFLYKILHKLRA